MRIQRSIRCLLLVLFGMMMTNISINALRTSSKRALTSSRSTATAAGWNGFDRSAALSYRVSRFAPSMIVDRSFSASPAKKVQKFDTTKKMSSKQDDDAADDAAVTTTGDMKDKLKLLWKRYGYLSIYTYLGIYATTLSSLFFALDFDVFNAATVGLDPTESIKKVCDLVEMTSGNTALPGYIREHPRVGTFAIAWVMTKFTEPIRLGVTVAVLPKLSKFLYLRKKDADTKKAGESA